MNEYKINTYEQLFYIIEEHILIKYIKDKLSIKGDCDILDVLDALDDLDIIEIVMELEKHYDLQIDDSVVDILSSNKFKPLLKSINRDKVLNDLGI